MALSAQHAGQAIHIAQQHKLHIVIWHPNNLAQSEIEEAADALTVRYPQSAEFLQKSQALPRKIHPKPLTHFPTVWVQRGTHAGTMPPQQSAEIVGVMPDAFWDQSILKMKHSIACL